MTKTIAIRKLEKTTCANDDKEVHIMRAASMF